jgi:hypothetical protein
MTKTKSRLMIGAFSMLGLAGWSWPGNEGNGTPTGSQTVAGSTQNSEKPQQLVLLTDGRIISGIVSEEGSMVVVTQPYGAMRFPHRRVEQVFHSIREVYKYKLDQLPDRDVDERLKLARWCLSQKLESEARQQLEAILEMSPNNPQAHAMLVSLDQAEARLAVRERDPNVRQTAGEGAPVDGSQPAALDASVISGARRRMGINDLPVVFDLPPALAVKRADEFARYVHPVLQSYCAKCHNERYEGDFQLVQMKTKADRTPDALRANLDATLRLVDRENPTRSVLLSSSLRPHGRSQNPRPIFQGSNDQAYRILATWTSRLKTASAEDHVVPASLPRGSGRVGQAEEFASDQSRIGLGKPGEVPPPMPLPAGTVEKRILPPMRYQPGTGMVSDTNQDPNEFPLPFAVTGKTPNLKGAPKASGPGTLPALPKGSTQSPASAGIPAPIPPRQLPASVATGDDEASASARKPHKAVKLDPSLLQKALQLKNQNRAPN